ncbi:MAG: glycine--tRNA ligase subunit beta [Pelagibacterales bacterium]|nr:glycine--tRNA ligase subunit beta [Pelagibacterales bacterium]OUU61795.1 MAG: glycine--tRNA ligase subunit beta [Alphaproteobacteria bacterium TMED62]|tara:strand:- start:4492 stop:6570 length:2079 start_codon:yes stop_codon:yes gene_type:complete
MSDLLLELLSEEMPASLIEESAISIERILFNNFKKNSLISNRHNFYYGPKRLTFIFYNLRSEKEEIFIKGPNIKASETAVNGFAKSQNTSIEKLDVQKTNKGDYYIYKKKVSTLDTVDSLKKILELNLIKIPWKKSMRWGKSSLKWIRPLKNILCLYGTNKIDINISSLLSHNYTIVGNLLNEKNFLIKSFKEYEEILKKNNVIFDQNERKKIILKEIERIIHNVDLIFTSNQKLLNEVVNLVENPNVFIAQFDKKYLKLPKEVLTTSMIKNQKYFPLHNKNNSLSNYFLIVSNLKPSDKGKKIIHGNQRVIEARLEDASFFWTKDNNSNFRNKSSELERVIFHNKLGSMQDKILRLKKIAKFFENSFKLDDIESKNLETAINISKNDLVSELVREFPSLQGTMGFYYALNSGFNDVVCNAVKDHYKPYGPMDFCPATKISKILALIDKLDTLVGFFLIDLNPTSSKDPYALRRAGLGIIRILIEGEFSINFNKFIEQSCQEYEKSSISYDKNLETYNKKILNFISERFENLLKYQNLEKFIIYNSLILNKNNFDIFNIYQKCNIIFDFINTVNGELFLKSFKRVLNILENENNLEDKIDEKNFKNDLLQSEFELELFETFNNNFIQKNLNFNALISSLVSLSEPINIFFEKVQINDKNILLKINRLCLLSYIKKYVVQEIDFTKIIKGKEL